MQGQEDMANQCPVVAETPSPTPSHWTAIEIAIKGTSFVVLVLLIVGIALDRLTTVETTNQHDGSEQELHCTWKELGASGEAGGWLTYEDMCEAFRDMYPGEPDPSFCELETIGEVWLAFGILGILAQAAAVFLMTTVLLASNEAAIKAESILRLAAMGSSCAFVLIQWSVWNGKGCGNYDDQLQKISTFEMGPSMILVIVAWVLDVLATALQVVNTLMILQGSSGRPKTNEQGDDLENGASIRS